MLGALATPGGAGRGRWEVGREWRGGAEARALHSTLLTRIAQGGTDGGLGDAKDDERRGGGGGTSAGGAEGSGGVKGTIHETIGETKVVVGPNGTKGGREGGWSVGRGEAARGGVERGRAGGASRSEDDGGGSSREGGTPWGPVWAGRRAAVGGGAPGRARRAEESGARWPCDEGERPIVGGGGGVGHGESGEAGLVGCPAR